ncbi:MAG: response regulator transcription factor [Anaerolineae bacterium]|jgi:DNA-binding response OmpR family regulator
MEYATLLLVDDDIDMLRLLKHRLEREGYEIMTAEGGRQALLALKHCLPDLAILDIKMPEMDGFQLAEQIKKRGDIPIIFLTSASEIRTRIEGIRRYAEDYVTKPYDYQEFLARLQRVLRRTAGTITVREPLIAVDENLSLDLSRGMAHTPAGEVKLSAIESKLMYHLVRNAGQTLPFRTLVYRVWGYADEASLEALRVAIYRLRRKVEPDPRSPRYILTDREIGYRFVALAEGQLSA